MGNFNFTDLGNDLARQNQMPARLALAKVIYANFAMAVEQNGWKLITHTDTIQHENLFNTAIIGVSLWHLPDIEALDSLSEKYAGTTQICVFDIDAATDVMAFLPEATIPFPTPVLAIYRESKLVKILDRHAALAMISSGRFDLI